MKKPTKTSLTRKLDRIVSEIVRSRGYCVRCGGTDWLQAAHIFSRNNRSVRWDFKNILCLCSGCHFWAHHNPTLFTDWLRETWFKTGEYNDLKERATALKQWSVDGLTNLYHEFEKIKNGEVP